MKAVAELDEATAELATLMVGYKPRFGDEGDIQLTNSIGRLSEMKEELRNKLKVYKGGEKLAKDVAFLARQVISQLKKHHGKSTEVADNASGQVRGEAY